MLEYLFKKARKLNRDSAAEDCETLLTEEKDAEQSRPQSHLRPLESSRNTVTKHSLYLLWLLSTILAVMLGIFIGKNRPVADINLICTEHVSQYSPLIEDISMSYGIIQFEGSLMHENIFRQTGSPEVDAAWESLGIDYRNIIVPDHLAQKSGLRQEHVHVSDKYGGGYPANVEGLHHLHCLNLVRKSLYYNFDYYNTLGEDEFVDDKRTLKYHVSHCLDIIRQQLMCTTDIGVLGRVWWNQESPTPFPDFNTKHVCRDFDAVRNWAQEHQVPLGEQPEDYLKGPRGREDVAEEMP